MRERRRDTEILSREDIGYGRPRPYEHNFGPGMTQPRERRFGRTGRRREPSAPPPGMGPYHGRLRRKHRPDPWVQADVEERLFHDTWIDADAITVRVRDGRAALIGMLPDVLEIRRAVETTRTTPGVRDIDNRLEVRP